MAAGITVVGTGAVMKTMAAGMAVAMVAGIKAV